MRKFHGYTADTMLNEYALRFYMLLEQSIKLDAIEWQSLAQAANFPHLDEDGKRSTLDAYESMNFDMLEHMREGQIENTPEELKKVMNG